MTIGTFEGPTGNVPPGIILPWFAPIEDVPPGWVSCDGNNGTLDMTHQFPKSVPDGTTDPGASGGQRNVPFGVEHVPQHSHSTSTTNDGRHNHVITSGGSILDGGIVGSPGGNWNNQNTVELGGSHSHTASMDDAGSTGNIWNEPNWHRVIFIQKL